MASLPFICPHCSAVVRGSSENGGKRARCPNCRKRVELDPGQIMLSALSEQHANELLPTVEKRRKRGISAWNFFVLLIALVGWLTPGLPDTGYRAKLAELIRQQDHLLSQLRDSPNRRFESVFAKSICVKAPNGNASIVMAATDDDSVEFGMLDGDVDRCCMRLNFDDTVYVGMKDPDGTVRRKLLLMADGTLSDQYFDSDGVGRMQQNITDRDASIRFFDGSRRQRVTISAMNSGQHAGVIVQDAAGRIDESLPARLR